MSGGIGGLLGQQAFQIAGHKVPYGAIAAVAGVAGVVLVLRARSSGSSVVAAGTPPTYDPSQQASGYGNFAPDYSGALANLSQQVSDLSGLVQSSAIPGTSSSPAGPAAIPLPSSLFPQVAGQAGAFEGWLQSNQARPDIAAGITSGRWSDLQGEFLRETNQYPKNWK